MGGGQLAPDIGSFSDLIVAPLEALSEEEANGERERLVSKSKTSSTLSTERERERERERTSHKRRFEHERAPWPRSRKLEREYETYAADADLIARGVVRPCASSVWRAALCELRDEQPGQYWAPIFRR